MQGTQCLSSEQWGRFVRGALGREQEHAARIHLESCSRCTAVLGQVRKEGGDRPVGRADGRAESLTATATGSSPLHRSKRSLPGIEGYHITGVIAQGGMGIVYRAVQAKLNRVVALKVLPAMIGAANPTAVTRFRREATAAARLHHTNIVPIYDFGESRDGYYYAMELISGRPLNELVRTLRQQHSPALTRGSLDEAMPAGLTEAGVPPQSDAPSTSAGSSGGSIQPSTTGTGRLYYQQVARWMADAAEALHYAHGQGLIHRDIKPSNLILADDGRIMIADFGLAKTQDEHSMTLTGSLVGTVRYLSPEQAMAKRLPVDHRTDIYSLGATLYELLCFQPAFPGGDEKQILAAIITRDPVRPRRITPGVPRELETICLKTLEKSPEARYASAREMADDLRRFVSDLPIAAKRPGVARRTIKFSKRHKAALSAVLVALVALGTGVRLVIERTLREKEAVARTAAELAGMVQNGVSLLRQGHWDLAAEQFQTVLNDEPNHAEALVNLAIAKRYEYDAQPEPDPAILEEAEKLCARALTLAPPPTGDHADAGVARIWNTRGVILKKLGRLPEAIDAYRKGLQITPDDLYLWDNLGIAHAMHGDFATAEQNLQKAATLAGTEPYCNAIAWRNLASLQTAVAPLDASAAIEQSLICDPSDPWTYALRAAMALYAAFKDGAPHADRDAAAANALRDAGTADALARSSEGKIKRLLAMAHLAARRCGPARENARQALTLGDDLPCLSHLVIAVCAARDGDRQVAEAALAEADRDWPEALRRPARHQAVAPRGVLWLESSDLLLHLERHARAILDRT